jgi:hypothetical protein
LISRRSVLAAAAGPWRPAAIEAVEGPGEKVSFRRGIRLLWEYRFSAALPKPYVHPLCAPDGRAVTLDSPPDHVHHRGLMLAWSDVNGFDFWGEVNPGRHGRIVQRGRPVLRRKGPPAVMALNHWVAEGRLLLAERRSLRAIAPAPEAVWVEWESELRAAAEPVTLSAAGHVYNGLGIRFGREMDGGRVLNARGTTQIQQADGEPSEWCAYWGGAPEAVYGVAIFDHPENPRYPTPFFVMRAPFGYLSAAPTYREPFRLRPGEALRLRWAVAVFAGPPEAARLEGWRRGWIASRTAG